MPQFRRGIPIGASRRGDGMPQLGRYTVPDSAIFYIKYWYLHNYNYWVDLP